MGSRVVLGVIVEPLNISEALEEGPGCRDTFKRRPRNEI